MCVILLINHSSDKLKTGKNLKIVFGSNFDFRSDFILFEKSVLIM